MSLLSAEGMPIAGSSCGRTKPIMATRAEQIRANQARKGPSPKAKKRHANKMAKLAKKGPRHANKTAGRKASFALEAGVSHGRPSRKSTRASANRSKEDSTLEIREEFVKTSPTNRMRKSRAKTLKVRGKR
jgi:hypothetical protein